MEEAQPTQESQQPPAIDPCALAVVPEKEVVIATQSEEEEMFGQSEDSDESFNASVASDSDSSFSDEWSNKKKKKGKSAATKSKKRNSGLAIKKKISRKPVTRFGRKERTGTPVQVGFTVNPAYVAMYSSGLSQVHDF